MSLTGAGLLTTVVLGCLLAMGLALAGWNRVRGSLGARLLSRLGMIVVCQLLAVAAVALWINDDNGLYTSWADLFGEHQAPPSASSVSGERRTVFNPLGGGLSTTYYRGPQSGLAGGVWVWTPPQYDQPAWHRHRFPVIMLLHGVPGSPTGWVKAGGATTTIAARMAAGTLPPAVLVMPRVDPDDTDTDCTNMPAGPAGASWLAGDVVSLVRDHFRVRVDPGGWSAVGVSTGGYCAVKLALQYPKTFGSAAALSPDDFAGDPALIPDPAVRRANSPVTLAAGGPPVAVLVAASATDPESTPANAAALAAAARPPTVVAPPLILPGGGHNWGTWHAMYPAVFDWVAAHLRPDPAP